MSGAPRVTIAGAGALGLATALALADAGCAVTVHEPGDASASSVAAGMLAPVFEAVLDAAARPHLDLLLAARNLWPGLAERAGLALERTGAIAVGEAAWIADVAAAFGSLGMRPTEISAGTAQALAPGLSQDFGAALLTREDWRLDARAALAALRLAAEGAGVTFRADAVAERGDADLLVIATGASHALAHLAPELAVLTPIKGHILRYTGAWVGATVRTVGAYAAPGDGGLAVGATMEPGRADACVDPEAARPLLDSAQRMFPGLSGVEPRIAAGVRAATPDGLPMVGASSTAGVLVAVGARRNGWLLAPLVASMVTACVTGRDPGPYAARLDPGRFGGGA